MGVHPEGVVRRRKRRRSDGTLEDAEGKRKHKKKDKHLPTAGLQMTEITPGGNALESTPDEAVTALELAAAAAAANNAAHLPWASAARPKSKPAPRGDVQEDVEGEQ